MAEGGSRFVWDLRLHLPGRYRLLFILFWDAEAYTHHFDEDHCCTWVHLFPPWDSFNSREWQWPQFISKEMQSLSHTPSSISPAVPRTLQSNGLAERMVKTVKELLSHSPDPGMVLLSYHAIVLWWCNLSLAELLMGCRIRTDGPQLSTKKGSHYVHGQSLGWTVRART